MECWTTSWLHNWSLFLTPDDLSGNGCFCASVTVLCEVLRRRIDTIDSYTYNACIIHSCMLMMDWDILNEDDYQKRDYTIERNSRNEIVTVVYERLDLPEQLVTLPASVQKLDLSCTKLKALPKNLPKSLKVLNISYTRVSCLPQLPSGLEELYCNDTAMKEDISRMYLFTCTHPTPVPWQVFVLKYIIDCNFVLGTREPNVIPFHVFILKNIVHRYVWVPR